MPDSPAFLSDRLHNEGKKSIALFQAIEPDLWDHVIYSDFWEAKILKVMVVVRVEKVAWF